MDSEKQRRKSEAARRSSKLMGQVLLGRRARLDVVLKDRKVGMAQVRVLYEISRQPDASGADVARACLVSPQSAQTMLAQAVARGWVVRGKNVKNGRLVTFRLTPEGEELLAFADAEMTKVEAEVWADVGLKELKGLNEMLEEVLRRVAQE